MHCCHVCDVRFANVCAARGRAHGHGGGSMPKSCPLVAVAGVVVCFCMIYFLAMSQIVTIHYTVMLVLFLMRTLLWRFHHDWQCILFVVICRVSWACYLTCQVSWMC